MANIISPNIVSFFQKAWTGTKDATNYVTSGGEQPYVIKRTLYIDKNKFRAIPYWPFYKYAFEKRQFTGVLSKLPLVIEDVGEGHNGNLRYFDFLFGDKKVVVLYDPKFMKVKEERTAFQMTAEKEKAILKLKNTAKSVAALLNKVSAKLALLDNDKKKQSKVYQDRLNVYAKKYLGILTRLKDVPELRVTADSAANSLAGIGAAPAAVFIVIGVIVALGIVAYTISGILEKQNLLNEYNTQADTLNRALDSEQQALADYKAGKITAQQYDNTVQNAQEVIKGVQNAQSSIIDSQDTGGFFDKIKNILLAGVVGIVAFKALDYLPQPKRN